MKIGIVIVHRANSPSMDPRHRHHGGKMCLYRKSSSEISDQRNRDRGKCESAMAELQQRSLTRRILLLDYYFTCLPPPPPPPPRSLLFHGDAIFSDTLFRHVSVR